MSCWDCLRRQVLAGSLGWGPGYRRLRPGATRPVGPGAPTCLSVWWSGTRTASRPEWGGTSWWLTPVDCRHWRLRSRLARLAQMQLTTGRPAPVVVLATTSHRRLEGWSAVLCSVANARRGGFLESCIDTRDSWRTGRAAIQWTRCTEPESRCALSPIWHRGDERYRPWSHVPRPIDLSRTHTAVEDWGLSVGGRAALDVIGHHPFLPTSSLSDLLGSDWRRALTWRKELVRCGLVRVVARDEVPANAAACARGRMRPDGYGLLRLGRREYGFFVEFDRGTVRPSARRAKFTAYNRYRSTPNGGARFPWVPGYVGNDDGARR
jgi:hypothetical protein